MSKFVIIPQGNGVVSHRNIESDLLNLPDEAEVFDHASDFEERLSDFDKHAKQD